MKVAALTAAAATGQAGALRPAEALALATCGGAEALGRADLGVLAPGHQAGLVLVRTDNPAFVPVLEPADLLSHIVWAASRALVSDMWIAGVRSCGPASAPALTRHEPATRSSNELSDCGRPDRRGVPGDGAHRVPRHGG